MTSIPVKGLKLGKDGKTLMKRPPRILPALAAGKRHKADRHEKQLRENAAKARGKG